MKFKFFFVNQALQIICIVCLVISCHSNTISNQTEALTNPLPKIDGFYIFKKDMSFSDVLKLLTNRKINYKILNKDDSIKQFFDEISVKDVLNFKNTRVIQGFDLPIVDKNLSNFLLGFINDTIFAFSYEHTLEIWSDSFDSKKLSKFQKFAENETEILKNISDGLYHKYGSPIKNIGNLNAFYPTSPPMANSYFEIRDWMSLDSNFYIRLESSAWCDTIGHNENFYPQKEGGSSAIYVTLNRGYQQQIIRYGEHEYKKEQEVEKELEKKRERDELNEKNKKFDSL